MTPTLEPTYVIKPSTPVVVAFRLGLKSNIYYLLDSVESNYNILFTIVNLNGTINGVARKW